MGMKGNSDANSHLIAMISGGYQVVFLLIVPFRGRIKVAVFSSVLVAERDSEISGIRIGSRDHTTRLPGSSVAIVKHKI
jgi:hypothetical protein